MSGVGEGLFGDRLAPDGTRIVENFARWFGRSQVVDQAGRPRVLFHGTREDFDEFDVMRLGVKVRNPTTRMGFFFSADAAGASYWATRSGLIGARVLPVFVAIERPLFIDAARFSYYLRTARASTIDRFIEKAVDKGHDGLRIDYLGERHEGDQVIRPQEEWWVPFDVRRQVKSALGNSGRFAVDSFSLTDAGEQETDTCRQRMRA